MAVPPAQQEWPPYCCAILTGSGSPPQIFVEQRGADAAVAARRLTCFGGKREPGGESPLDCIVRECREEMGWAPRPQQLRRMCDLFVDGHNVAWFYEAQGPCAEASAKLVFEPGRGGVWVDAHDERISLWHATVLRAWEAGQPRADHISSTEEDKNSTAELLGKLAAKHQAATVAAATAAETAGTAAASEPASSTRTVQVVNDSARAQRMLSLPGSELVRHSFLMALEPLSALTPDRGRGAAASADRWAIAPLETSPSRLAEYARVMCDAYPESHPDYDPDIATPDAAAVMLAEKLSDDEVGATYFYASLQAVDTSTGRVVAAILVRDMHMPAGRQGWVGGPWVDDVFVTPSVARLGIGSALLRGCVSRLQAAGHTRLGLLVTAENGDAKAWYERAGFAMTHENWRLKVSAAAEDADGDEATAKHARPRAQRMLSLPGTVRRWLEISGGAVLREATSRSYDELVAAHGSVRPARRLRNPWPAWAGSRGSPVTERRLLISALRSRPLPAPLNRLGRRWSCCCQAELLSLRCPVDAGG